MALESYCAACTYMGETSNYNGKYWCERKSEERYACDPKCGSFCEAYSRSNGARENMYENSSSHKSSGCYITTIVCDILGNKDDCYTLQKARELRNEMQNNPYDYPALLMYDQIGPQIAECLMKENEEDRYTIAEKAYKNYLTPTVMAIEKKQYNKAKDIYILMTNNFAKYYGIDTNIIIPDKINKEELGHGRARIRKPQTNY